jgi:hypothetical protein
MSITYPASEATVHREGTPARRGRLVTGGLFLSTGGVHLGIVAAGTGFYRHFADHALPFVHDGWATVFMAAPAFFGLCLFAGETLMGVLLLAGGRWARAGWLGVIAFQVLLMLFGVGFWLWSLPALAVLVPLARADWPSLSSRGWRR